LLDNITSFPVWFQQRFSAENAGTTLAIATQGADLTKIDEFCSDGNCTTGVPE